MKHFSACMKKTMIACLLLSSSWLSAFAANTKTTVSQVTTAVTLDSNVDYIVTDAVPFGENGTVNITKVQRAVLILAGVRPSKAKEMVEAHVLINGAKAVVDQNCQLKMYDLGSIIYPYDKDFKPLTVYSGKSFAGTSCNDFGLENTGGFMNTLTEEKLNNQIRSFKLKRGYMVTFSLLPGGRGYSRCFIAANEDLEVSSLPTLLDKRISSYRIFKWVDANKIGLAATEDKVLFNAMPNVTSCYNWGKGSDNGPDVECVPHHIYENWPAPSDLGTATWSPHMKTNNEPNNTDDDPKGRVETVDEVLANWEDLMATGMRLCAPATHDGGLEWDHNFLDSIDARGWRCDIIDLHCYWPEWNLLNQVKGWTDRHHRPVWISEWTWGSDWDGKNLQGIFNVAKTASERDNPSEDHLNQNRDVVQRACENWNASDFIERYYYWNHWANVSKLYYDGKLTPAGEMYSKLNSGLAYNGKYDFVPTTPPQRNTSALTIEYDKASKVATLRWHDYNGEMNRSMLLKRRVDGNSSWKTFLTVDYKETGADYVVVDSASAPGYQYQVIIKDIDNVERKSNTATAVSTEMAIGDEVAVGEGTKYLGGNLIANGDFDMEAYGWTSGTGEALGAPYFQVIDRGGNDNGSFLQFYASGDKDKAMSVNTVFDIRQHTDYYYSIVTRQTNTYCRLQYIPTGVVKSATNATDIWMTDFKVFNSEANEQIGVIIYEQASMAKIDQVRLCRLFATRDSAIADGVEQMRKKADAFMAYNSLFPVINADLSTLLAATTTQDEAALQTVTEAVDQAIAAYQLLKKSSYLKVYAQKLVDLKLHGYAQLQECLNDFATAQTIQSVFDSYDVLQATLKTYLPMTSVSKIVNSELASAGSWTTKAGTYTGGDQRLNQLEGVTCWNAWWSGQNAGDETKTMMIKQDVKQLEQGLYMMECKASTQHYCLSDQHGFISNGTQTESTDTLKVDYMDLPFIPVAERWQTLYSAPVYVGANGGLTIGFESSKKGAVDNAWIEYNNLDGRTDKREGWWCATSFRLKYMPLFKTTVVPNQWGVICLPYAFYPCDGMKLYEVVGINTDYTQLCLQEIESSTAGMPCIYRSEVADVTFLEYGEPVTRQVEGKGNIRGFFETTASAPTGYYFLTDGVWEKVGETRPRLSNYTGIMRPFTDALSKGVPVLSEWEGETMPITGVTDAEKEYNTTDIIRSRVAAGLPKGIYTLDGRNVTFRSQLKPGVYLKVVDGRCFKTIVR